MEKANNIPIWHPKVHWRFSEYLCFFLLRVTPFNHQIFFSNLKQFMADYQLSGYQAYPVYGAYDVLLRVWLPVGEEVNFSRAIAKTIHEIYHVNPFVVSWAHHCWPWDMSSENIDRRYLNSLAVSDIREIQNPASRLVDAKKVAMNHGLLKIIPITPVSQQHENRIKFITAMEFNPVGGGHQEQIIKQIYDSLVKFQNNNQITNQWSLYWGIGFCKVLVKCETDTFYNIYELVNQFMEYIGYLEGSSQTYIIASDTGCHFDNISERTLLKMETKDHAVNAIIPEIYLEGVPPDKRTSIETWVKEKVLPLNFGHHEKEFLHTALVGVLNSDDISILNGFFNAFIDAERFLRENYKGFIGKNLGDDYFSEIYREAGISQSEKHHSFGDLQKIYAAAIKRITTLETESELTQQWQEIAKLRNDVAHGNIVQISEWKTCFEIFVEFLRLFHKLKSVVTTFNSKCEGRSER